jgi:putative DNA primase/helicase
MTAAPRQPQVLPNGKVDFETVVAWLEANDCRPHFGSGGRAYCCCPLHPDHKASCTVSRGDDVEFVVHCHVCDPDGYFERFLELVRDGVRPTEVQELVAKAKSRFQRLRFIPSGPTYDYEATTGVPLRKYRGTRSDRRTGELIEEKSFAWKHLSAGQWHWGCATLIPRLYRPEVTSSDGGRGPLFIVEGEKDADRLAELGHQVVSPSDGAGTWRQVWTEELHDTTEQIVIIADDDEAGRRHALNVAKVLATDRSDRDVLVKSPIDGCNDISDHLEAGKAIDDLRTLDEPHVSAADELLMPPPSDPVAVARTLIDQRMRHPVEGNLIVRWWRGDFYSWTGERWRELTTASLRAEVYCALAPAVYMKDNTLVPWEPNRRKVGDVLEALQALMHLDERVDPPEWIEGSDEGEVIPVRNGLLRVMGRRLNPHTPRLFNLTALSYPYSADAPKPRRWLRFLNQLWPEDDDSIALLQEFFGYVISADTDQHKIALMVGPPRSGKGTITRVLTGLVGVDAVAAPTLASLSTQFGLQPLIGKTLAAVGDVRLGRDTYTVTERLLSISGEDSLTVDRKYRAPWTGRLGVRFLLASNELPRLGDASGALASRFIVLQLTRSWLGHEDLSLSRALETELDAILNWSLDGLSRLRAQRRFTAPKSSVEALTTLEDLSSPIRQFVREETITGAGNEVPVDDLYSRFRSWCLGQGRDRVPSKQVFGRDLRAALPGVGITQPRDGERRLRVYRGIRLRPAPESAGEIAFQPVPAPKPDLARDGTRSAPLFSQFPRAPRTCVYDECDEVARSYPGGAFCSRHAPGQRTTA